MKPIPCPIATFLVPHVLFLTKKWFTPLSFVRSLTHCRIAPRNYGSWKPITEDTKVGELSNAFWMILSSHHWGPLRNMLWPAVRTSKHLPSNGGPIMIPDPFPQGGPPQAQELRRNFHHVLPQQIDPNTTFEGPHSSIPNHQPLLRACWGRSAFRRSQGNPAVSLSGPYPQPVLHTPPTLTSTTSTRPTTSDPTSRRQWLAQSPVPPTSSRSSPTHTD